MDIKGEIIRIIAEYKELEPSAISPEQTFEELGIDSLDAIEIIYSIEEKLGIEVPPDAIDLNEAQHIGDIMTVIDKLAAAQADADSSAAAGASAPLEDGGDES